MDGSLLEYAQKLAEGARAKVAEDRKRLEELRAKQQISQTPSASTASK